MGFEPGSEELGPTPLWQRPSVRAAREERHALVTSPVFTGLVPTCEPEPAPPAVVPVFLHILAFAVRLMPFLAPLLKAVLALVAMLVPVFASAIGTIPALVAMLMPVFASAIGTTLALLAMLVPVFVSAIGTTLVLGCVLVPVLGILLALVLAPVLAFACMCLFLLVSGLALVLFCIVLR